MKYSYFYISDFSENTKQYDLFMSGYDECDRTLHLFEKVRAKKKYWMLFPQYSYSGRPSIGEILTSSKIKEDEYVNEILNTLGPLKGNEMISIDCSGILIPHVMCLLNEMNLMGIHKLDLFYSSPRYYQHEEDTEFGTMLNCPRTIAGFANSAHIINGDEFLIMCAGFNEKLVCSVSEYKGKAKEKHILVGFPPLEADMYQQNLIKLHRAKETIGETGVFYHKIPAYDPFATAEAIEDIANQIIKKNTENLALINIAPLSTKICAIATALVCIYNPDLPIQVLFAPSEKYFTKKAVGISKSWVYTLEFPNRLYI